MDCEALKPDDARYPKKLRERLGPDAPTLYFHGPLKLLDRFCLSVVAGDQIPGQAMIASNDMLFTVREYSMNYVGPWWSVMETEIFRLALDVPKDPDRRRSLTILTARGLEAETWDNFLGDRFGYKGPFTGFPQKDEFYRRAKAGEILWLSITPPQQKRLERSIIRLRNWVACALGDAVFFPFSEKGAKSFNAVRRTVKAGLPVFTCQYGPDKETDVNKDLFALGIPSYTRKTVGKYLESLGATRDAPPPFPPPPPDYSVPDHVWAAIARKTQKPRQMGLF
jgi:hypothetical protein